MSTPNENYADPGGGAMTEILSAMSSLHMDPDPIKGARGYLSETDNWAKHAVGHLHVACSNLQRHKSECYDLALWARLVLGVCFGRDLPLGFINNPSGENQWIIGQLREVYAEKCNQSDDIPTG